MSTSMFALFLLGWLPPPVETSETPSTRLLIRTQPAGATVQIDGQPQGKSDALLLVPPGVRQITITWEGQPSEIREIELPAGRITKLEVRLAEPSANTPQVADPLTAPAKPPVPAQDTDGWVQVSGQTWIKKSASEPTPKKIPREQLSEATRKILDVLEQPSKMELIDVPLNDVLTYLKELHNVEIQLDVSKLQEVGVDGTTTTTANFKNLKFGTMLRVFCHNLAMTYVIHEDLILLTSPDARPELLLEGAIDPADYRVAPSPELRKKITESLKKKCQLEFVDTPLSEVVNFLEDAYGLPIQVDRQALSDLGLDVNTTCTLNVKDVAVESGLRVLTRNLGLIFSIEDEYVWITRVPDPPLESLLLPQQ